MAFLYTADNPHAPRRSNGRRFWGQPNRHGGTLAIRTVVLHTAETDPRSDSAERVARWQRDTAAVPSSYHRLVDSHSTVVTLPDEAVAFHVRNFNTPTLGLSFATRASLWGRNPTWDTAALERGAAEVASWCDRYAIPVRLITASQARNGQRGIVTHAAMDPSRRTDPGAGFPMDRFLNLVRTIEEDAMPTAEEIAREVWSFRNERITERDAYSWLRNQWDLRARIDTLRAEVETIAEEVGIDPDDLARRIAERLDVDGASADEVVDRLAERLARDNS